MKLIFLVLMLSIPVFTQPKQVDSVSQYWNSLQKLCGKSFAGMVAAAPADDTTFKDKRLVMRVISCQKNQIKIPFFVGEDKSRTWILTRVKNRILLKHDHRHEDGEPDKVTMYGGLTSNLGSPIRQMFPADDETVKIIPAAAGNVWWIDVVDGDHFSYNLRRMGTERFFSIKFDLKNPIDFAEVPWGWKK